MNEGYPNKIINPTSKREQIFDKKYLQSLEEDLENEMRYLGLTHDSIEERIKIQVSKRDRNCSYFYGQKNCAAVNFKRQNRRVQ